MRLLSLIPLVLASGCVTANSTNVAPAPRSAAGWTALAERAEASDTTLDFRVFRETFAATDRYAPYGDRDRQARNAVDSLLAQTANAKAYARAKSALGINPTDATMQLMAHYAAEQLGDSAAERHHAWMFRGLLESVLQTGNGTEAAPFVVISVDEEYDLARYLRLRRQGTQALGECGHRPCDFVTFTTQAGTDTTLAFDITLPYHQLERSFRP